MTAPFFRKLKKLYTGAALAGLAAASACSPQPAEEQAQAQKVMPNILLIVVDDMGYTDLGVFGGEIETPRLDALARSGIMLTNFHAAATCSPTRAMLLSGTDHHLAGLGNMNAATAPNQRGHVGYEGYLNFRVATLAELLRDAGYRTYMTGKWHLGLDPETSPAARGFDRSYVLLQGGGGHFDHLGLSPAGDAQYREDGRLVELPPDFYSTRFYARKLVEYLDIDREDDRPFFGYLAFSAPHWPLQAPKSSIAKYAGRYDEGYDVLHAERMNRLTERGLWTPGPVPFRRLAAEKAWTELTDEEQRVESRKMEIYAAMVDDVDVHVGQVIDYLESIGEFDDTLIFFMSDNGAEGHDLTAASEQFIDYIEACCDNGYDNLGQADSYVFYGPNWARAGVGPYRMFKAFSSQGGIHVPAFVSYPALGDAARKSDSFATVMDIMPTFLELAGTAHPGTEYRGRAVLPMKGRSMLPMLRGETDRVHPPDTVTGWELFGKRAIRQGDWKLLWEPEPYGPGSWQLYDLSVDPTESNDLSGAEPEVLQEMIGHWERYATENNVILPNEVSGY